MRKLQILVTAFVAFVAIGVLASTVLAGPSLQEDSTIEEADDARIDTVTPVAPLEPPIENRPAEGEEEIYASSEDFLLAVPQPTMNYQGYLTDASGDPIDGTYTMVFSLWNAASAGNKRWGDETQVDVLVQDGLFQAELGSVLELYPYTLFDEQLFLQVSIEGTILPRQQLRAVPYAMGLVVGTRISGSTTMTNHYGLDVRNSGGRGIFADGQGDNVYGIYNADVTYSEEGYAGPDSYIWLPAADAVIRYGDSTQAHLEAEAHGKTCAEQDVSGSLLVDVLLPVDIEVPHGRNYLIKAARIYYQAPASNAYISRTSVRGRNFSTGAATNLVVDTSPQNSSAFSAYTVEITDHMTVTSAAAPTSVEIQLRMTAIGSQVCLYGARLQLDTTY